MLLGDDNGVNDHLFDPDLRWDVDHDRDLEEDGERNTEPLGASRGEETGDTL